MSLLEADRSTILDLLEEATPDEAEVILAALEAELYDWPSQARPEQLPPPGDWLVWLILAGRGFGKTRTGAEWAKERAELPEQRIACVAATKDDFRDTMVEGESGLLAVLPPSALRGGSVSTAWNRSLAELYLANKSKFKGYSAEKPDQLRGPQHHAAWCDEPMSWADAHRGPDEESTAWANLMLGLRLGADPRCVVTGTPKPKRLLIGTKDKPGLLRMAGVVVTRGSTYDNLANLAPTFREQVLARYEGTRTGRQELHAEVLEEVEGALWSASMFQGLAEADVPELVRVVTAIDPAVTSGEDSDDTGIVTAGVDDSGQVYVLSDDTCHLSPEGWARVAISAANDWQSDRIVGETNNGGDMVESVLRAVAPSVPYRKVTASRGKRVRAEPVAALYEQGRVHHVGDLSLLEDQLTSWTPDSLRSPDRLDALVWAVTELAVGRSGRRRSVVSSGRAA